MPSWTTEKQLALLLAIIDSTPSAKTPPWDIVVQKMNHNFTVQAMRQQYNKLRREAKNSASGLLPSPATPATPVSRKRKMSVNARQDDDERDERESSPSPLQKKKARVKIEPVHEIGRMRIKHERVVDGTVILEDDDDLYN